MIYDTTQNITWLADWNYAVTSGYAAANADSGLNPFDPTKRIQLDGRMGWRAADTWASNLVYGGFSDWRLPSTTQPDQSCSVSSVGVAGNQYGWGLNCIGGEMGHLFHTDLGGNANQSVLNQTGDTSQQIANQALFFNMTNVYWSEQYVEGTAWTFAVLGGFQNWTFQSFSFYAVAVRPGDVISSVPEPHSLALALLAFGAMAVVRRRE